ncbi:vacuolar protein sorting-associated protein 72 homolog [Patiria miniata]|uniref:Vacuolar protein sorting-associated protein 72 homolog n=1 Tax=Patiria miniata TaxID=46514 RepID=A0A914A5B8_PATMI|nr:vacuolar protein sorting-associated protein 72 homolog [Patiria miniata]XP_038058601.1 vacuolar protein sorting-associated protein 72 homolog [Patiria miniata]
MALALTREKRVTAGNRMSRMLQEEEQDEFYKTTYGGFEEQSGDEEYTSEESDSDATDSDISDSEDDEVISDDEGNEKKRQRRTVTKAYKEPVTKPAAKKPSQPRPSVVASKPKEKEKASKRPAVTSQPEQTAGQDEGSLRKSSRRSTVIKGTEFQIRLKEREERAEINRMTIANRSRPEVRRLTQEELLEEATLTEEKNLISLQMYHKLEAEKKKTKFHKKAFKGPFIRFHSMTMPEVVTDKAARNRSSGEENAVVGSDNMQPLQPTQRCSRSFITFSEEASFIACFPKTKSRPPAKPLCPVTRQRAMYLDPITNIPYANKEAFKTIREAYESELESQSDSKKRKVQKVN